MSFVFSWFIGALAAGWVWSDAKVHHNPNAVAWALFALFLPLVGVPVYFVVGRHPRHDDHHHHPDHHPPIGGAGGAMQPMRQATGKTAPLKGPTGPMKGPTGQLKKPATGPIVQEPKAITSYEDFTLLIQLAIAANQAQKADEVIRLMTRVFTEAALSDLAIMSREMGKAWLASLGGLAEADQQLCKGLLDTASDAIAADDFPKAFEAWGAAVARVPFATVQHPGGVLVLAGIKGALGAQQHAQDHEAREAQISQLIDEATRASMNAGSLPVAIAKFEAAAALIAQAPDDEQNRTRRSRIGGMLDALRQRAAAAPAAPARAPLPAGTGDFVSLVAHAADQLGRPGGTAVALQAFEQALAALPADDDPQIAARRSRLRLADETLSSPAGL